MRKAKPPSNAPSKVTSWLNPEKGEYFLPSVVSQLVHERKARANALSSHDKWYGVTYHEDKPKVCAAIAAMTAMGTYPSDLWEKESFSIPKQ